MTPTPDDAMPDEIYASDNNLEFPGLWVRKEDADESDTRYIRADKPHAECERLGMENALLREVVRDLSNILSDVGPAFEALHDDWIEIEGCEPYQPILDQVAEIKHMLFEKHAATIAAAGGE